MGDVADKAVADKKTSNEQVINDAFYNSALGEKFGKIYQAKHTTQRFTPSMKNELEKKIKASHNVQSLSSALKSDLLTEITLDQNSREYLETVSAAIYNNADAKKSIEKIVGASITKPEDLTNINGETGKKFIKYLQKVYGE